MKILYYITNLVYADPPAGGGVSNGIKIKNPLGDTTFLGILNKILDLVFQIGVPVLVLFIVYAGFKFVVAQGSEKGIEDAKKSFYWAIIGGAILIGAKVIATVVTSTLGVIQP